MIERVVISNKQPPPLQGRIKVVLDNPNASASELSEIIAETELAIVTADEVIASERASAADLTSTPSAEAAQDAISRAEAAGFNRDRLHGAMPKLRDKLSAALAAEARDKWQATCNKVKAEQEALLQEYKGIDQAYRSAKAERDKLIERMEACDLDASRVNDAACELDIWDRQLEPLLESPAPKRRWGPPKVEGSFAASYAQSMVAPYHPGQNWSDPEEVARRRQDAEREQNRISAFYAEQTAMQESARNEAERKRFQQQQRRG
jgi:hypothetical protein